MFKRLKFLYFIKQGLLQEQKPLQEVQQHTCPDLTTACDDCKKRFTDWLHEDEGWRKIDEVGKLNHVKSS